MNLYFADTSYLLALELEDDQYHTEAKRHWHSLSSRIPELVITSFIFGEVVTFLNNRGLHKRAVQLGNTLLKSSHVRFVQVETALFAEGWSYFQQHQDKDYSLADCISFVLMRDLGISTAFTFDRHFEQAGFTKEP